MHNNLVLVPGAKLRRALTYDVGDPRLECRAFLQLGVQGLTRLVSETDIAQGLQNSSSKSWKELLRYICRKTIVVTHVAGTSSQNDSLGVMRALLYPLFDVI